MWDVEGVRGNIGFGKGKGYFFYFNIKEGGKEELLEFVVRAMGF